MIKYWNIVRTCNCMFERDGVLLQWDELLITSLCFEFDSIGQINNALLFKRLKACQIFHYQISACTINTLKLIPMKTTYNIWQALRICNWKDKQSLRKEDVMTGPLYQTNPLYLLYYVASTAEGGCQFITRICHADERQRRKIVM